MDWSFSISRGSVLSPFPLAVLGRTGASFFVYPLGPFFSLSAETHVLGGSRWILPFPLFSARGATWGALPSYFSGSLDLFFEDLRIYLCWGCVFMNSANYL